MFLSTQLCQAPLCIQIIPIPFSSQYRLYFLHWHRNTLAPFFLCYLDPLFWAYLLLLLHLYNFHCSWPSLYPVDPFSDFSAFCFSLHSFTIVRHSSLSLVVVSCAIEILYFSSAYLSLDKDSITSFLVVLSRNSINNGLAVPISVAFPTLKILFMSLFSLFIFGRR